LIARRSLLVLALVAGLTAGALYFIGAQRTAMVVASRDVAVIRPLTAEDLDLRSVPPDALPPGALSSVDDATFHTGLTLRPGERAIAIPVVAVSAVGGSIAPGARIDVLAVPVLGRAPAGRGVELLAADALVLDVRTESGAPYVPRPHDSVFAVDRIGSVIIAIAPADEIRFADRIATSSFVLAFSSAH
jgi:hypothetical protein